MHRPNPSIRTARRRRLDAVAKSSRAVAAERMAYPRRVSALHGCASLRGGALAARWQRESKADLGAWRAGPASGVRNRLLSLRTIVCRLLRHSIRSGTQRKSAKKPPAAPRASVGKILANEARTRCATAAFSAREAASAAAARVQRRRGAAEAVWPKVARRRHHHDGAAAKTPLTNHHSGRGTGDHGP